LFGDLHGLPPILVQVGDREILLDDSICFAEKAKDSSVDITLHVWEGMVHCFPLLAPMFPEATQAWEETITYIKDKFIV
jgi:acetyl esterase/lipase